MSRLEGRGAVRRTVLRILNSIGGHAIPVSGVRVSIGRWGTVRGGAGHPVEVDERGSLDLPTQLESCSLSTKTGSLYCGHSERAEQDLSGWEKGEHPRIIDD